MFTQEGREGLDGEIHLHRILELKPVTSKRSSENEHAQTRVGSRPRNHWTWPVSLSRKPLSGLADSCLQIFSFQTIFHVALRVVFLKYRNLIRLLSIGLQRFPDFSRKEDPLLGIRHRVTWASVGRSDPNAFNVLCKMLGAPKVQVSVSSGVALAQEPRARQEECVP